MPPLKRISLTDKVKELSSDQPDQRGVVHLRGSKYMPPGVKPGPIEQTSLPDYHRDYNTTAPAKPHKKNYGWGVAIAAAAIGIPTCGALYYLSTPAGQEAINDVTYLIQNLINR